jgi:hypothetical protein
MTFGEKENMKTSLSSFSCLEQLGIALMVAGIGLGFYGRIFGPRIMSSTTHRYYGNQEQSNTLKDVKYLVENITNDMTRAQKALQLEGLGKWWFFTGLGIFVVSKRSKWNADLQDGQTKQ